ncbi:MAG: hypothetical protein ACKO38_05770, partial [Planctomycetota bacterium]
AALQPIAGCFRQPTRRPATEVRLYLDPFDMAVLGLFASAQWRPALPCFSDAASPWEYPMVGPRPAVHAPRLAIDDDDDDGDGDSERDGDEESDGFDDDDLGLDDDGLSPAELEDFDEEDFDDDFDDDFEEEPDDFDDDGVTETPAEADVADGDEAEMDEPPDEDLDA